MEGFGDGRHNSGGREAPGADIGGNTMMTTLGQADPRRATAKPDVTGFYDEATYSIQYVVADPATRKCAVIDPVLDFDPKSGATATRSADRLLQHIDQNGLTLEWILDTHPHADHFSAAGYLKEVTGAPTAIGARIVEVQKLWKRIYDLPDSFRTDGSQWDRLFADGDRFTVGSMDVSVMLTPGHTLCSVSYVTGDAAFVHDTLFMPDSGSARADFPGGDAQSLWRSMQRILALPEETRLFTGHDYGPGGREIMWESTVASQKAGNAHVRDYDEEAYVELRHERDRTLPMPKLILSALQVNLAGGRLPEPEQEGRRYLKIPLNAFPGVPWG
jgi:glyoxylase-like metal-dependent hydrolase (beta-lactamase superfamily II)